MGRFRFMIMCERPVNPAWRMAKRWHADCARGEREEEESLGRGGREGARPVGARGVSLDPRFRRGDDTGRDGSSGAPTRALRHSRASGNPGEPGSRPSSSRRTRTRHSRASGNPGEVGSARPPGPRYVAPSRASDRILANPRRRKQEGVHRTLMRYSTGRVGPARADGWVEHPACR